MIIIGIATTNKRRASLIKTLQSLNNQTVKPDMIYIYNNDKNINLTDNGKFYGAKYTTENDVYFTCDDDIHYPETYIENTIKQLNTYPFVTYHGRILHYPIIRYYRDKHIVFSCLTGNNHNDYIDVCGTGVSAYNMKYITKETMEEITNHSYHKMTDPLASYTIYKNHTLKPFLIAIEPDELKDLGSLNEDKSSCYEYFRKHSDDKQTELIKKIYMLWKKD